MLAYLDGELTQFELDSYEAHLGSCAECENMLERIRNVDGLLVTGRPLEAAPNFTFKVMAEVRAMPVPRVHRHPTFAVLASYLVFAWTCIGLLYALRRPTADAILAFLGTSAHRLASCAAALGVAASHVFGQHTVGVTASVFFVLVLDLALAAALAGVHTFAHARAAVRLRESREVVP